MPLIGTAGHVDHGKSTLIQRLTGRDPDRWEEEKRRGLTIDLGFAWTVLPSGTEVSFVDVPGHERYLKNMLAGVEAIDVALFVVAADEGWMPQSEEHLAVLDLLEVERGLVALTKSDLVDTELVELAMLEVAERLAGTSLAKTPIIPVSAIRDRGIDVLTKHLDDIVTGVPSRDTFRPRLWIDRSFPVRGAGTVVTGTLLGGRLVVDDEVTIYPGGRRARIRAIQTHERPVDEVEPGRRVALNLSGVEHGELKRGDMVGYPGQWSLSRRFSATVRAARYVDDLDPRGAYQLHIGSATYQTRFLGIEEGMAVLSTEDPVPVAVGDRFIVRDTGRRLVTAGGRVLDPSPGATAESLSLARTIDPEAAPDEIAAALLRIRRRDLSSRLSTHSCGGRPGDAIQAGEWLLAPDEYGRLAESFEKMVSDHHREHPLRPGAPMATLAERLDIPEEIVDRIVTENDGLIRVGPDVAAADHRAQLPQSALSIWERARQEMERSLAVPTIAELGIEPEVLHLLLRRGDLSRLGDQLVYLPEQVDEIRGLIAGMSPGFTVAQFRDATGLSRKYAVPILEWADREGLTVREGDTRRPR
ncbi:MAG: selenocysteine-specific translation elongation factor [Acidimicrobiia bacterium]